MRSVKIAALILGLSLFASAQSSAPRRQVYNDSADAKAEIARTVNQAGKDHKRILLVFGGNWCGDCLALDTRFHEPPALPILQKYYHVIHVSIGLNDRNLDLASKYEIPLKKGVPAIAVLDSTGKLIYSQKNGEFEAARRMDPKAFVEFLNQWKPAEL